MAIELRVCMVYIPSFPSSQGAVLGIKNHSRERDPFSGKEAILGIGSYSRNREPFSGKGAILGIGNHSRDREPFSGKGAIHPLPAGEFPSNSSKTTRKRPVHYVKMTF